MNNFRLESSGENDQFSINRVGSKANIAESSSLLEDDMEDDNNHQRENIPHIVLSSHRSKSRELRSSLEQFTVNKEQVDKHTDQNMMNTSKVPARAARRGAPKEIFGYKSHNQDQKSF